jgi:glycosyltransferase 2 family protein
VDELSAPTGFDPADLHPLQGEDRRSARYLVSSHAHPELFVKVVTRERRDSDLLYRAWSWLRHRGRPPSRLGMRSPRSNTRPPWGCWPPPPGEHAPAVLLVRSVGNGAGLLVQQRVHGRDLTQLGGERLDRPRLTDLWEQVASLRRARIAHRRAGALERHG